MRGCDRAPHDVERADRRARSCARRGGACWPSLVLVALVGSFVSSACQPQPPSPPRELTPDIDGAAPLDRETIVFNSDRTGNFEIYAMRLDGSAVRQLTDNPRYHSHWPRVSPDRRTILFYRTPAASRTDARRASMWLMAADGSRLREARPAGTDGWEVQGHGEWSPDGRQIAMHGGRLLNSQIFVTDATGRNPRAVTARPGRNLDPSWSPDGTTIVFVGCETSSCPDRDLSVYSIPSGGGVARRLTSNGLRNNDPYFSPDGRSIAWISETVPAATPRDPGVWNIVIMAADGTGQRRLTDDDHVNSVPQWSPDSGTIYFHRLEPRARTPWRLFSIRPDGSGMRELSGQGPGNNENPSA